MKFIHCADLHLDSALSNIESKASVRREEILQTFERMCDYAENNGITAIIIAGDAFDGNKVTKKTSSRFINAIERSSNVDFIYLSGNHDEGQDFLLSTDTTLPKNLKIFDSEWSTFEYGNVRISGARFNGKNADYLYDSLSLLVDKINIVVMHGQVVNHATSESDSVSLPRLKDKNIDYLALGHYHSFEQGKLDSRGNYAYSGCLEGRGFDETGEKGFILLDVENKVDITFVPFANRSLFEVEYDISNTENFAVAMYDIYSFLTSKYPKKSAVKVVLKGEHRFDYDVDVKALEIKLNSYFFFGKVKDKTTMKIEKSDYDADKSVRGEFVRLVLESDLDEQTKSKIIICGINALKGENV